MLTFVNCALAELPTLVMAVRHTTMMSANITATLKGRAHGGSPFQEQNGQTGSGKDGGWNGMGMAAKASVSEGVPCAQPNYSIERRASGKSSARNKSFSPEMNKARPPRSGEMDNPEGWQ